MQPRPTRRDFLATAATFAVPMIVPASAFGANERIVTGHIGVGGQGTSNLKAFLKNAAAVCDVDRTHLASAARLVEAKGGKCSAYGDYRKILDRKDLDAVVVSTPDHWHGAVTIHACQAGKDVYCEKPLSLTVAEGRAMVEAARKHGRVVQTGSQQRSAAEFRRACELVRSGKLGKISAVLVGLPGTNFGGMPVADSSPPPELDYDSWLGPAPQRPYNAKRVHYNFRFFWDYSGGQLTNWGAHHLDIAQWGLGMDDTGPISIEGTASFHPQRWFEVTTACQATLTYASGVKVVVGQDQKDVPGGVTFVGSEGKIFVNRGKITSTPEAILKAGPSADSVHLYESKNHHQDFLDCVKTRKPPICDVAIGHRSATACHLTNIALRTGRKITWDPAAERIIGDAEADAMLSRPYRLPYVL